MRILLLILLTSCLSSDGEKIEPIKIPTQTSTSVDLLAWEHTIEGSNACLFVDSVNDSLDDAKTSYEASMSGSTLSWSASKIETCTNTTQYTGYCTINSGQPTQYKVYGVIEAFCTGTLSGIWN